MAAQIRILKSGEEALLESYADGVFDDPINPESTRAFLADPRHHLAVAIDAGVVVGFASGVHYLHPDKPSAELWINEVGVAPTHRRLGLASRLLQALFQVGQALGCKQAWVLTERKNLPAKGLYSSLGGSAEPVDPVMYTFHL